MKNEQRVADSNFDRLQARNGLGAKNQSQMSKLIPMLQLGSKNGPSAEKILENLQKRVDDLQKLDSDSVEAFRRLPDMGNVSRERQLKRLTDALHVVDEFRARGLPQGTSGALRAVHNELTSLREISYLGELDNDSVDLTAIGDWRLKLAKLIKASVKKIAEQRPLLDVDAEGGLSESELKDPVFGTEIATTIHEVKSGEPLPKLQEGQPYAVARTSVIPVPKNGINENVLRERGFNFTSIGGYLVLSGQLVLTIDPKSGKSVEEVLRELRKGTKQKFALVSPRQMPSSGHLWHWLMREPELDAFISAFPGKSLQLRNWGLC
jgi:hypothetical protein